MRGDKTSRSLSLLGLLIGCLMPAWLWAQAPEPRAADWTTHESLLLYFEAITKIKQNALPTLSLPTIVRDSLKAYVRSLDPFSDYLTPDEYATFRRSQQAHYAGVGMVLAPDRSGQFVCMPYPHSPAARAGIAAGDILTAIDGERVTGQSSLTAGMKIRGEAGTPVRLRVATSSGRELDVTVIRAAVRAQSVLVQRRDEVPIVQILSFTGSTPQELEEVFTAFDMAKPVIIDLRGNPGGSLYDAIDAAMLFLDEGQEIVRIRRGGKLKVYRRELPTPPLSVPLYLWQDERTASAAEVFIAALRHHARAVSIGTTTFGKGTIQEVMPLSDRSALYLTIGAIQTPSGYAYHRKGLGPTHVLGKRDVKTEHFLAKVKALLRQKKATHLSSPEDRQHLTPLDRPTQHESALGKRPLRHRQSRLLRRASCPGAFLML